MWTVSNLKAVMQWHTKLRLKILGQVRVVTPGIDHMTRARSPVWICWLCLLTIQIGLYELVKHFCFQFRFFFPFKFLLTKSSAWRVSFEMACSFQASQCCGTYIPHKLKRRKLKTATSCFHFLYWSNNCKAQINPSRSTGFRRWEKCRSAMETTVTGHQTLLGVNKMLCNNKQQ